MAKEVRLLFFGRHCSFFICMRNSNISIKMQFLLRNISQCPLQIFSRALLYFFFGFLHCHCQLPLYCVLFCLPLYSWLGFVLAFLFLPLLFVLLRLVAAAAAAAAAEVAATTAAAHIYLRFLFGPRGGVCM